jgi:hypothetical protein
MSEEKLYEVKVIKNGGAKHHLIKHQGKEHFIHHKWDGPAIEPIEKGGKYSKKQYFLEGIEYTPEDYKDIMKNREGLPWYKQSSPKGVTNRN